MQITKYLADFKDQFDLSNKIANQIKIAYGNDTDTIIYIHSSSKHAFRFEQDIEDTYIIPDTMGILNELRENYSKFKYIIRNSSLYGSIFLENETGKEFIGIIQLIRKDGFIKREIKLFEFILHTLAPLFKNARINFNLNKSFYSFIDTLSSAIDARDFVTSGHSHRVALYTQEIAKVLNYNYNRLHLLYYACLLHDIGKIGVPESILFKTSALTSDEFLLIKSHPKIGYDILKKIFFPFKFQKIPEIIYQHHERLDGSGYPRNLIKNEICQEARIMTIGDIFDALTSQRQYRKAMNFDLAFKVLQLEKDKKLIDPELFEIFLHINKNRLIEIKNSFRI